MTESEGEIIGMDKRHDAVCLSIFLAPELCEDPMQVWEWKIGERVKVIGNEPSK